MDLKGGGNNNIFIGRNFIKYQWLTRRNKFEKDKYCLILGEIDEKNA